MAIGEPIRLQGRSVTFTSWRYVNPGCFAWETDDAHLPASERSTGLWGGDGDRPARFVCYAPRGLRLASRSATLTPIPAFNAAMEHQAWSLLLERDGDRYRAWYTIPPSTAPEPWATRTGGVALAGHNWQVCHAESADGFTWTFPHYDHVPYAPDGRYPHVNVVYRDNLDGSARGVHGMGICIDPSSTDERYKMVYLGWLSEAEYQAALARGLEPDATVAMTTKRLGLCGAVSPDGIHWRRLPEPLMLQHADTWNTCYYDAARGEYVVYTRHWEGIAQAADVGLGQRSSFGVVCRRAIARARSRSFRSFPTRELVQGTGADLAPGHLWYTNAKTTLPCDPDQHIMLPWRWELERDSGDCWLLSTPYGEVWSQVPGPPALRRGAPGSPTCGHIVAMTNMVALPADRWAVPYLGFPIPHKYPGRDATQRRGLYPGVPHELGYAIWPRGRVAAMEADAEGECSLLALMPPGRRLTLNATIPADGYIQVRIGAMYNTQPGRDFVDMDPIHGDSLDHPVSWGGERDIGLPDGMPVVISLRLRHASLYAVDFTH